MMMILDGEHYDEDVSPLGSKTRVDKLQKTAVHIIQKQCIFLFTINHERIGQAPCVNMRHIYDLINHTRVDWKTLG